MLMFQTLLQINTLYKIVLNTLLVSLLEEFYLVMFTYILMGEFDHWQDEDCRRLFHRWDIQRILTPVLMGAILSNILRYMGFDNTIVTLLSILAIFAGIIITGDIFNNRNALAWIGNAFIFLTLGVISVMVAEFIYMPIILYGLGKTMEEINNNVFLNFAFSLPSTLLEYLFLIFLIIKKRTLLKANIIKPISNSKAHIALTSIVVVFDLIFMLVLITVVCYDKILINSSFLFQIFIIIGTCIFPLINIFALAFGVYLKENKAVKKDKDASEKLKALSDKINLYTNDENYDNIKWKLNEINMEIEEISQVLYLEKVGR